MIDTIIVAVRATIVRFQFRKVVQICETILVKMTRESLKSNKNRSNWSHLWLRTLKTTPIKLQRSILTEFNDSHIILTRIVSWIRTSFQNQNRTIVARTVTILVCVVGFPRQNWAGWMIHRVFFLGGPHSNCLLYDGTSKSTLKAAMSYMTYTRWKAWEKSKMQ